MPIQTLNELRQLRESHFGRPNPRHGLRLLYWLANDFISFKHNQMFAKYDPEDGCFGFHCFYNWNDDDDDDEDDSLLPEDTTYYEVGNLNDAEDLPDYVRTHHTGNSWDNSNSDRIILGMDEWSICKIYVTQHSDKTNFSRSHTYRISQGLIRIIQRLSLTEFLEQTHEREIPYYAQQSAFHHDRQQSASHRDSRTNSDCACIMAVLVVVLVMGILAFLAVSGKR